ncbi:unnamed protein product [Brachionus calyciflorus]|uniref:Reverse transcriptase domain-containing protein n=1 Tax=Brachionus calyciflorus TaxID=104777 RepID=A0A814F6J4_9BILA|nr:unnamed protein product [Brachionus calyciflorus]
MSDNKDFNKFIDRNSNIFVRNLTDIGLCKETSFKIETNTESPIMCNPYRQPISIINELKKEIEKILEADIIQPGNVGTSASPAFLIKQKGGSCFIVDYRKLNALTKPFLHPIPRIDDILDKVSKGKVFSRQDLRKGHFQIPLDEQSRHKTGFVVPFGIYEFKRVPFGLCNAPSFFSRFMFNILGHLDFVQVYLDDIIIFSQNGEEHREHLKELFKIVRKNNLKLNGEKCNWLQKSIKILGQLVEGNGIKMDEEKINAIVDRKPPKNLKELQSFLGLCNFYSKFVKDFAKKAAPLHNLCKPDVIFFWNSKCEEAFKQLKE